MVNKIQKVETVQKIFTRSKSYIWLDKIFLLSNNRTDF